MMQHPLLLVLVADRVGPPRRHDPLRLCTSRTLRRRRRGRGRRRLGVVRAHEKDEHGEDEAERRVDRRGPDRHAVLDGDEEGEAARATTERVSKARVTVQRLPAASTATTCAARCICAPSLARSQRDEPADAPLTSLDRARTAAAAAHEPGQAPREPGVELRVQAPGAEDARQVREEEDGRDACDEGRATRSVRARTLHVSPRA